MPYDIVLAPLAERQFRKLQTFTQRRLKPHIDGLATEPRPDGTVKVQGESDLYRIRVGDYRIVYYVWDREHRVMIVKIGHRRDIYR